jgi:hypothetical protein
MKIANLTTTIMVAAIFGISQPTFAAARSTEKTGYTLTSVSKINKIEIRGNVELYISDGIADEVKVYGKTNAGNASAPDQNGVLRISSFQAQKLVVWVTASDLRSIAVYDNAEVRSFGVFSAIDLDVKLYDNASVQLNMDAYLANVTLNDHSKATLSGNITEVALRYDRSSFADTANLTSMHLIKTENFEGMANL